jgi:hypothetical protein
MMLQSHVSATVAAEASSADQTKSPSFQSNTRACEPDWPTAVDCPDGCGAQVWVVGNEQGHTLLLDMFPVASGTGGYVVEPVYVGPSANVEDFWDVDASATSKQFIEITNAWNWYGTYESPLVTSSNSRFGLHVLTCSRKTMRQRVRAINGQRHGGCCIPRSERNTRTQAASSQDTVEQPAPRMIECDPSGQLRLFSGQ